MASETVWMPQWVVAVISLAFLILLVIGVFSCICCKKKDGEEQYLYIIEECGVKKSFIANGKPLEVFRRFSVTSNNDDVFTSDNLPIFKVNNISLEDNNYIGNKFGNSVLKIDDMASCISSESKNSFYTTYPTSTARQNSRADSFVSIDFDSDRDKLI